MFRKQETVVDLKSLYGDVAESSVFIANQDSYGNKFKNNLKIFDW